MAENIDLNISIGANTTDLQAQLQKAENLLLQFQNALKKATNVGEINYLNNSIKNLNTTIGSLNQQMNTVGRPTKDATNALTNLSRVAQDAPYGFIGIANNLNPLLESFQRLSKDAGGAGGALKSMVAGLTGPAGIGIALGVVSSIVVAFGDDIGKFITEKMQGLGKAFTIESNLVKESSSAFVKASTDIDKLKNSFELYEQGSITKDKFLKEFNATLGDTIAKTNDLATAEKFLTQYADTYIEMTFKKAVANEASAQAAKKLLDLEISKGTPITPTIGGAVASMFGNPELIGIKAAESKIAVQKGLQGEIDILKNLRKVYDDEANKLQLSLTNTFGVSDVSINNKPSAIVNYAREENKQLTLELAKMKALRDKMKQIGLEPLKLFELPSEERAKEDKRKGYFQKQSKDLLESTQKEGGFGSFMQGMFKKDKNKIDSDDAEKKRIDDLNKSYNDFAYTLSNNVTNALMGMYDAMQSGQSPLQAIGDMFANIGKQIAAAVIQALIFTALLEAFPALKGVFAAMGAVSSGGGVGKLLGMASGGIATGPTLAMIGEGSESEAVLPLSKLGNIMQSSFNAGSMNGNGVGQNGQFVLRGQDLVLAMQRSNSSLNIIRG